MTRIRLARPGDAPAIQAIDAPHVRSTAISFELEEPSVEEMRQRIEGTLRGFPWLVCCRGTDDRLRPRAPSRAEMIEYEEGQP